MDFLKEMASGFSDFDDFCKRILYVDSLGGISFKIPYCTTCRRGRISHSPRYFGPFIVQGPARSPLGSPAAPRTCRRREKCYQLLLAVIRSEFWWRTEDPVFRRDPALDLFKSIEESKGYIIPSGDNINA